MAPTEKCPVSWCQRPRSMQPTGTPRLVPGATIDGVRDDTVLLAAHEGVALEDRHRAIALVPGQELLHDALAPLDDLEDARLHGLPREEQAWGRPRCRPAGAARSRATLPPRLRRAAADPASPRSRRPPPPDSSRPSSSCSRSSSQWTSRRPGDLTPAPSLAHVARALSFSHPIPIYQSINLTGTRQAGPLPNEFISRTDGGLPRAVVYWPVNRRSRIQATSRAAILFASFGPPHGQTAAPEPERAHPDEADPARPHGRGAGPARRHLPFLRVPHREGSEGAGRGRGGAHRPRPARRRGPVSSLGEGVSTRAAQAQPPESHGDDQPQPLVPRHGRAGRQRCRKSWRRRNSASGAPSRSRSRSPAPSPSEVVELRDEPGPALIEAGPPEILRIPVLAEGADPGKIAPSPLAIRDRLIVDSRLLVDHDPERLFAYDVTPAAMKHLRGVASPGDRIVFRRGGRVAPDRVCAVRTPDGRRPRARPLQGAFAAPAPRRGRARLRVGGGRGPEGPPRDHRRHPRPPDPPLRSGHIGRTAAPPLA